MKITVYTITDCEFSREEKEYLASHQLQFEEKNLETNKEFLTEMLVVSNNFAGTPVTKIEKDDGKIEVLKGFTKDEFDKVLGFVEEKKPIEEVKAEPAAPPTPPVQTEQPAAPATVAPVDLAGSPQANDPLNSILQDLQEKSSEPTASTPTTLPNVPDFQNKT